jgi:hypothetical protein
VHIFYSDPVIGDQFPGSLVARSRSSSLPIPDLLATQLFQGIKLAHFPVGTVFGLGRHTAPYKINSR